MDSLPASAGVTKPRVGQPPPLNAGENEACCAAGVNWVVDIGSTSRGRKSQVPALILRLSWARLQPEGYVATDDFYSRLPARSRGEWLQLKFTAAYNLKVTSSSIPRQHMIEPAIPKGRVYVLRIPLLLGEHHPPLEGSRVPSRPVTGASGSRYDFLTCHPGRVVNPACVG